VVAHVKVKADIPLPGRTPPQSYGMSLAIMGSHSVTCHPTQVNAPRLTPAMQVGTRFTYAGELGRLSWPSWLDSAPAGSRTSDLSITSPTPNHCTTKTTTESQRHWKREILSALSGNHCLCESPTTFQKHLKTFYFQSASSVALYRPTTPVLQIHFLAVIETRPKCWDQDQLSNSKNT